MADRIIDISEEPAKLNARLSRLVIAREGRDDAVIPLEEIAAVSVSHPRVSVSHGALSGLAAAGAVLVVCDDKRMPVGMMLPLAPHYSQTERFAQQASAPAPANKKVWKQIVSAKIMAQGRLLKKLRGDDRGLMGLSKGVKSGDKENHEAYAAVIYWPALFDDPDFRRKRDGEDQNRLLNYGYAVLRAIVARAICASGLHPSIGVHHHNRYDSFCLASDLMEPFRPMVDEAVVKCVETRGPKCEMDRETKAELIGALTGRMELDGESRTLFDVLARTASSLAAVYAGKRKDIILPDPTP